MTKLRNILSIISAIVTIFFIFLPSAFTQSIPPYINYQGKLIDQSTGAPITQVVSITFSLYSTNEEEIPIYQQTLDVNITNGIFSAYIGMGEGEYNGNHVSNGIPAEVFTEHSAQYIGIKLADSETEMIPRQQIASVAYAYKTKEAVYAEKSGDAESLLGATLGTPSGIATLDSNGTIPSAQLPGITVDSSGNVSIGTTSTKEKLSVDGVIESTIGGLKFPDGTIQITAAKEFPIGHGVIATAMGCGGNYSSWPDAIACPSDNTEEVALFVLDWCRKVDHHQQIQYSFGGYTQHMQYNSEGEYYGSTGEGCRVHMDIIKANGNAVFFDGR